MNAKHSAKDPNWLTPGEGQKIDYVGRIRKCLGGVIDLDPYSSDIANTQIRATRYYTPKDDGHAQPWDSDAILVNHPGLQTVASWKKLCSEVYAGRARGLVWVGFSVEQLNLLSDPHAVSQPDGTLRRMTDEERWEEALYHPLDFSVLFTRSRIDFIKEDTLKKGGRPSHGNYLCGIGVPHAKFVECFGDLGHILAGPLAQTE